MLGITEPKTRLFGHPCAVLVQREDPVAPVAAEEPLLVPHNEALLQLLAHAGHGHGVLAGAHLVLLLLESVNGELTFQLLFFSLNSCALWLSFGFVGFVFCVQCLIYSRAPRYAARLGPLGSFISGTLPDREAR